jgi:hypothetical protein
MIDIKEQLVELFYENNVHCDHPIERLADYVADLIPNDATLLPCKVGQTVYKICPKCNDRHDGSCNHCAWSGCHMTGCDIGVRVYSDGSCGDKPLQIVPRKVTKNNFVTTLEYWNLMYFATEDKARTAMSEYDTIRKIEDRNERYAAYKEWEKARACTFPFLIEN